MSVTIKTTYGKSLYRSEVATTIGQAVQEALDKRVCLIAADLARADLMGIDFCGRDLSGANFRKANIACCNFTDAILDGVDFGGCSPTTVNWGNNEPDHRAFDAQ